MRAIRFVLPVVFLVLAGGASADPPDPSICLSLTCFYHIPDETAPHKGVVEVENSCQGIEWFGTLEILKTCGPSNPCAEETTTDTNWSIGPGTGTQATVMDCTDEDCCSPLRSGPGGPWIMSMDFSATLMVDSLRVGGALRQLGTPIVLSCSQSGDVVNTRRCPRDRDE